MRTLYDACRVLMITRPAASTAAATGDICGVPSRRSVASTAWCCSAITARASSRSTTQPSVTNALEAISVPSGNAEISKLSLIHISEPTRPY